MNILLKAIICMSYSKKKKCSKNKLYVCK